MKRKTMDINGLTISYLDNEKDGQAMVCLHGHFGTGSMFKFMEKNYSGRVIVPDLRGHGLSEHAASYKRDDYIDDLKKLIDNLGLENPILLGHSLGGVNVYQYASIYKNVSKIIVEDIGTEILSSNEFIADFPVLFDSIWDVSNEFEKRKRQLSSYFMESLYYDGLYWKFRFRYQDMIQSQIELNGDYWSDWENITCPILLLHGAQSWACKTSNIKEMASRNKHTILKIYENAGHAIHEDESERFCEDIKEFLNTD
jgi:esterase